MTIHSFLNILTRSYFLCADIIHWFMQVNNLSTTTFVFFRPLLLGSGIDALTLMQKFSIVLLRRMTPEH